MAARGIRNNNPGNIEYGPFAKSMGATGSDGRFAVFPTAEQGIAAITALQQRYENSGRESVAERIERWAPASENGPATRSYINAVARAMGVDPNASFSINDQTLGPAFIAAMIAYENGRQPYTQQQIAGGYGATRASPYDPAAFASTLEGLLGYAPSGEQPNVRAASAVARGELPEDVPHVPVGGKPDPNQSRFYPEMFQPSPSPSTSWGPPRQQQFNDAFGPVGPVDPTAGWASGMDQYRSASPRNELGLKADENLRRAMSAPSSGVDIADLTTLLRQNPTGRPSYADQSLPPPSFPQPENSFASGYDRYVSTSPRGSQSDIPSIAVPPLPTGQRPASWEDSFPAAGAGYREITGKEPPTLADFMAEPYMPPPTIQVAQPKPRDAPPAQRQVAPSPRSRPATRLTLKELFSPLGVPLRRVLDGLPSLLGGMGGGGGMGGLMGLLGGESVLSRNAPLSNVSSHAANFDPVSGGSKSSYQTGTNAAGQLVTTDQWGNSWINNDDGTTMMLY